MIVTRASLREALENGSVERATELVRERFHEKLLYASSPLPPFLVDTDTHPPGRAKTRLKVSVHLRRSGKLCL